MRERWFGAGTRRQRFLRREGPQSTDQGCLDRKMVTQTAVQRRVPLCHADFCTLDCPSRIRRLRDEDIVEALGIRPIFFVPPDFSLRLGDLAPAFDPSLERLSPRFGPPPRIPHAVAGGALGFEFPADADAVSLRLFARLRFRFSSRCDEGGGAAGGGPDVRGAAVRGDETVCEGVGQHVEIAARDCQVAAVARVADELGDVVRLGGAVAEVGVVGFALVGRVEVGGEDLDYLRSRAGRGGSLSRRSTGSCGRAARHGLIGRRGRTGRRDLNARARHTLAHVPVTAEEGGRPPVQRIRVHGAFDDGPAREDGEAGAEDAGVEEFAVGQDLRGLGADGLVVFLGPDFLETDDVGSGRELRKEVADVREPGAAVGGEVL